MPVAKINIAPQALLMAITQIQVVSSLYEHALSRKRVTELGKQLQSCVKWPQAIESLLNQGWEVIDRKATASIDTTNAVNLLDKLVECANDEQSSSQTIGDYVDTNIPVIAQMQQEYGSRLEKLTQEQKIHLLSQLCDDISITNSEFISLDITYKLGEELKKSLTEHQDVIDLIKAIASNL
ncbi:MAG: hypothetical protein F6K52_36055 [Moorea sp. SIO3H5]|nr:hypothetical protein [Moorena sp. SIO3H5]